MSPSMTAAGPNGAIDWTSPSIAEAGAAWSVDSQTTPGGRNVRNWPSEAVLLRQGRQIVTRGPSEEHASPRRRLADDARRPGWRAGPFPYRAASDRARDPAVT